MPQFGNFMFRSPGDADKLKEQNFSVKTKTEEEQ
jgi:hypothetical protein